VFGPIYYGKMGHIDLACVATDGPREGHRRPKHALSEFYDCGTARAALQLPRDETMGAGHRRISGGDATPDDPLQHQPGALASPTFAWRTAMEMPTDAEVTRFRPMLDFIANNEGTAGQPGDGYNTSLGFGRFIGGEKILVAMTLQQIDALQT